MAVTNDSAATDRVKPHALKARLEPIILILSKVAKLIGFGALLVGLWQLAISLGLLHELIVPTPGDTAAALAELVGEVVTGEEVLTDTLATLQESVFGFAIAACSGFAIGVLVAETSFGREVVMPYIIVVNALPKIAFAPVLVAWFGFGILPKALMAAFIAFFPLLVVTISGLTSVDHDSLMLMRSLRARRFTTLFKLKVPGALPQIFAGLKTATVFSVTGAVVAEFLGGGDGLGGRIRTASGLLAMPRVFALITLLGVVALLFYGVVALLERKIVFWQDPSDRPIAA